MSSNIYSRFILILALSALMKFEPTSSEENLKILVNKEEENKNVPKQDEAKFAVDEELQTAPSVTSVAQVWTSSSSESLNELSPELISKFRNDIPFLAAYALRPRLVGASSNNQAGETISADQLQLNMPPINRISAKKADLETQQTSSTSQRQQETNLIPKLGDFSEFKVETSSTSRSEHHHKRKTSLKRKAGEVGGKKRQALKAGSQLMRRRQSTASNKRGSSLQFKGTNKKSSALMRSHIRTGRLRKNLNRRNLQHHMNIIKHGRLSDPIKGQSEPEKDESGTKGGKESADKKPFYTKLKPSVDQEETRSTEIDNSRENEPEDEEDEAKLAVPKRVGDDDVEEGGDTVTVMPKSDGVDDDPEIEDGGPVEENDEGVAENETERETNDEKPELDSGGRRVNREKPNEENENGNKEATLGGGFGATTGSKSESDNSDSNTRGRGATDSSKTFDQEYDDNPSDSAAGSSRGREKESGVEFAHDDNDRDEPDIERKNKSSDEHDERKIDSESNEKRPSEGDSVDVDYQDEMIEREKKHSKGRKKDDCDDGSYNHNDDHHHHHHDHHDSIKWLQDAIPGEPNIDYPTLNRVNSTNFNCRDQKYPGFYADVESRCQVFHICQADGRQDSFLCPNGTIFSQTSTVCVWWNSFDCEDAPKYYQLNALLYKKTSEHRSIDEGADRTFIRPKEDREEANVAPIDHLIVSMRRSKGSREEANADEEGSVSRRDEKLGPNADEDEATIQRKTTSVTEDQSGLLGGTSSRIRTEHRRDRRASTRQAPPKLKSRRVSRYSRRRKLRHGLKPKRRA